MIKYFTLFIMLISLFSCGEPGDRKVFSYEPLTFDGNNFVVSEDIKTKNHFDKVQLVLDHYKIVYVRLSPTALQLPKGVSIEMVMSFGEKAESNEWLTKNGVIKIEP